MRMTPTYLSGIRSVTGLSRATWRDENSGRNHKQMATRVNFENAVRKLQALGNVLHRPIRDVLDSGARVAAISLAKSTEPKGTGAEAKDEGEKAVARDILLVYGNAGRAFEAIRNPTAKKQFWRLCKQREFDVATGIALQNGVNVGDFDGGTAHKAARRKKRPVILKTTKPSIYIIEPRERKKLDRYIKESKDDVGTAKGGWADCVRAIGGNIRGLREDGDITASWITAKRKAGGAGAAHHGGTDENPTIVITNRIPYVDQMLSNSARNYALKVAHDRMIENLETAVLHEASNLRKAV